MYKPAFPAMELKNIRQEHSDADRVGRYRIGQRALFYPAFPQDGYILLASVCRVWSRSSCVHATGCCAGGIPVIRLWVHYTGEGGEQTLEYVLDHQEQADRMLALLRERCPGALFEAPTKAGT